MFSFPNLVLVAGASLAAVVVVMVVTAAIAGRVQGRGAVVYTAWSLGFLLIAVVALVFGDGSWWRRILFVAMPAQYRRHGGTGPAAERAEPDDELVELKIELSERDHSRPSLCCVIRTPSATATPATAADIAADTGQHVGRRDPVPLPQRRAEHRRLRQPRRQRHCAARADPLLDAETHLSGAYSFRAEGSVTSSHTGTTYGFGYTEQTR